MADVAKEYASGEKVGVVAEPDRNGGWGPHLHVQCMRELDTEVDGYGRYYQGMELDFPDPVRDL